MGITTATKRRLAVRGEYTRNGYEVWIDNRLDYAAGNHIQDSSQPALCKQDRLPLKTIRQFCIKTAREITAENHGRFAGVGRVPEECDP